MQVQRHLHVVLVHPVYESFRVWNEACVPAPASPSVLVPVHVHYHNINRDAVVFNVHCYVHEVLGCVSLVFAVPVTEHVVWRHRYSAGYFHVVAESFLVIMSVAEDVPVGRRFVCERFCPIHSAFLHRFEGECTASVAALGTCRFVDKSPSPS